jgi:hypothetical protein
MQVPNTSLTPGVLHLWPRHHVYAIDYYSSTYTWVIYLYQGPYTRASVTGMDDDPTNK